MPAGIQQTIYFHITTFNWFHILLGKITKRHGEKVDLGFRLARRLRDFTEAATEGVP